MRRSYFSISKEATQLNIARSRFAKSLFDLAPRCLWRHWTRCHRSGFRAITFTELTLSGLKVQNCLHDSSSRCWAVNGRFESTFGGHWSNICLACVMVRVPQPYHLCTPNSPHCAEIVFVLRVVLGPGYAQQWAYVESRVRRRSL